MDGVICSLVVHWFCDSALQKRYNRQEKCAKTLQSYGKMRHAVAKCCYFVRRMQKTLRDMDVLIQKTYKFLCVFDTFEM